MQRCAAPTLLQKGLGTEMYLRLPKEDGTTGGIQQIVVAEIDGENAPTRNFGMAWSLKKGW